ncbi:MAG: radical SAM protein [Deltaproteobacteria bacterium]|nr:radical SAM protein [Deltaproteobacteria bacterium]
MRHSAKIFGFRNKDAERFPQMVVVAMSFICNARCIHCPNAATGFKATLKGSDRLMSWEVLRQITEQCAVHPTLMRISSFGEILMHPEAIDMICYILDKKKDKNVALTTNGSLLTAEKARQIMENGIRSIEFSVDAASRDIYEKIRVGLSWRDTLENIIECVEVRNQNNYRTKIMVSVIEQPANERMIEDILSFWNERVDKVLLRKMLSFKGIIKRPDHYQGYMQAGTPCPFLWERLVVDPLGDVRGCVSDLKAELNIGNIMKTGLDKIWHAPLMEFYRKKHLSGKITDCPLCKDCVDLPYRSWNYNYFSALDEDI